MARSGIQRSGIQRSGIQRSGTQRSGTQRSGTQRSGIQAPAPWLRFAQLGAGLRTGLLWSSIWGASLLSAGHATSPWLASASAQEVEVDGDYRLHDTVYIRGQSDPLRGTILSGAEPSAARLKIRLVNDIITELARDRVDRIVPRQTPASAYKARAAGIASRKDASLHGRLGAWVLGHGMNAEAEAQFALAANTAGDPQSALPYRVELVNLLELRLDELSDEDPTLSSLQEAILTQARAPGAAGEPALLVARARVLVELGMPERSLAPLTKARGILEIKAAEAPQAPEDDGEDSDPAPEGSDPDESGDEAEDDDPAPPRRPIRRFGRDGERIPPLKKSPAARAKAAPVPPTDNSAELLPGLNAAERALYRVALGDLAAVALMNDAPETAQQANARILEIWPEDKDSLLSQARLASWAGDSASVIQALEAALRVHVEDPELLLARGQLRYLSKSLGEAQADLERAVKASGSEGDLGRATRTALALVHLAAGRTQPAASLLETADADPGYGPARLAKALLSEISNDPATGAVHADEAARLLRESGGAGEAHYLRAYVLQRAGKTEEAARALLSALQGGYDFQLVSRARIELARAQGDAKAEARLVELLVRSSAAPSPDQLAALGRVYVQQGRVVDGERVFKRGLAQTPTHAGCLRGMAYCAYVKDDRLKAHAFFKQLLEQDPEDTWSKRGLKQLEQVNMRRVWTDDFQRADGEVLNAWSVESPYGVGVSLASQTMRFAGQQANDARGKTLATRSIEGETVAKFAVRLRVSNTNQGRVGIRLEFRDKKIVLFRSPQDGRLYASTVLAKRPWTEPVDLGPFGKGAHTIAVDIEDVNTGRVAFLRDGIRLGELKLSSLTGRRKTALGIYAQGTQLGETLEFSVEQVWVYVERSARQPKRRGLKRARKEDGGGY